MPILLWRRCADALVTIDRAAGAAALALCGRVVPELPRRLGLDRGDQEAERRHAYRVKQVPRGSTEPYKEEQEANERHRRLAKDRDQAKVALQRALDGNNMAAMVAAAKALIEFDRSPERDHVTV